MPYLSRHLSTLRTGHLQQALHIFKYLDIHEENTLALDPTKIVMPNPSDDSIDQRIANMRRVHRNATDDVPPNAPEPLGQPIQINCFVDSSHANDLATRRSQTGILMHCNMAPIVWCSKRKKCVQSSTFGSEFVALRIATELIIAPRYKSHMFGIKVDGPANVFCGNESAWKSVINPESTLAKKHDATCYHKVRESIAAGIIIVY